MENVYNLLTINDVVYKDGLNEAFRANAGSPKNMKDIFVFDLWRSKMSNIIKFPLEKVQRRLHSPLDLSQTADILIFEGVRYEKNQLEEQGFSKANEN